MTADEPRPAIGAIAWVTLGLLFLSWAILIGLLTRMALLTPMSGVQLTYRGVIAVFVLVAHALWGYVAWRGRHLPRLSVIALVVAAVYAFTSLQVLGSVSSPQVMRVQQELGLNMRSFEQGLFVLWGLGWLTGLPAVVVVYRRPRSA